MAKALFDIHGTQHVADSAGYEVDKDGQTLEERAAQPGSETDKVIAIMKELGVDVSKNIRTQTSPELLAKYDKVVAILLPDETPDYFINNPKVEFWRMYDPKGASLDDIRASRDEISERVDKLLTEINGK